MACIVGVARVGDALTGTLTWRKPYRVGRSTLSPNNFSNPLLTYTLGGGIVLPKTKITFKERGRNVGFDFKHGRGSGYGAGFPGRVDRLADSGGTPRGSLQALRALSLGNTDRINKWTTGDYLALLEVAGKVRHGTYNRTGEVRIPA